MRQPSRAQAPGGRLPGLEALRFVAALCVLLLHARAVYGGTPVFGRGYLGVDFFLMLSGFLMTRVQEPRLDAGLRPGTFLVRRYRRLWPMMAAGALLGLPRLWVRTPDPGDFLVIVACNLALLPVLAQPFLFPINIPAWTIFFELFCNAAHVLALRHLRRWALPAAILLLAPVEVWLALHRGGLDWGARPETLLGGGIRVLFAYLVGMALARLWRRHAVPPVPAIPAILAMPLVLALGWWLGLGGAWFDLGFVVLVAPAMIAGGLRLHAFARAAARLGQLSFPLFALQMPVLEGLRQLGLRAPGAGWIAGTAALGVGIAGAVLANALGTWRKQRKELAA